MWVSVAYPTGEARQFWISYGVADGEAPEQVVEFSLLLMSINVERLWSYSVMVAGVHLLEVVDELRDDGFSPGDSFWLDLDGGGLDGVAWWLTSCCWLIEWP